MANAGYDKLQTALKKAIKNDTSHTFEDSIPVLVTLDNGVEYDGHAFEVQPKSDHFPNGLVMVRTATSDLGVPINYIQGK